MIGRIAAVAAAVVLAAWSLVRWSWEPNRCNAELSALEGETIRAENTTDPYVRLVRARRNLERLNGLRRPCANEVRTPVLLAANEELVGRIEDAERDYLEALRIEHRPEIYMALGNVQIQLGKVDAAVDSYTMAVRFHPVAIDQIRSEEVQRRIRERLRLAP